MSKSASESQEKFMSRFFRGKGIFKPLNTGRIDERVCCIREFAANIYFYTKGETTIMVDAGYNYDRLEEKMQWLGLCPADIRHILITHQDTDHVGAVEADSAGLFRQAQLYMGRVEYQYLTGERQRKVFGGLEKLPRVVIPNPIELLDDGEVFTIDGIRIECFLVPGHTWGHLVYLIDDAYLFMGDTLWLGADGGQAFLNVLAEDNRLARTSLLQLRQRLESRGLHPLIITGHTGWTDDAAFAFAHIHRSCNAWRRQKPQDPAAPDDSYDESEDTRERAQGARLPQATHL